MPEICKMDRIATAAPGVGPIENRPTIAAPQVTTVCHPVYGLDRGGLEQQLINVVNRLSFDAFNHIVVVRGWNDIAAKRAEELGPNVTVIGDPTIGPDREWPRKLATILEAHAVDVLHIRGVTMLVDGVIAAEWANDIPVVASFHGLESADTTFGGIRRKLIREALLRCKCRWTVGPDAARTAAQIFNLPTDAFDIIVNGVDTTSYLPARNRDEIRRELELPLDRFVLLCVGNIKPVKGHDVLIDAFMTTPFTEEATLIIVGEDYSGGEIPAQARSATAGRDIRFVGVQDDVRPWYQAADAFVLPSRWEGLSNALLEALACGLPAIATNVGGNPDVIRDGVNGRLVPANDPRALSIAMHELACDEPLRYRFADEARRSVIERFDASDMVASIARQYRSAASHDIAATATALPRTHKETISA
ncbi:MAG: glycosyltransferase family 4 protein [Phycisphaerales bacterium]|nr:glycosyltransferase family 4 protein [Phycisphaerales bacterium]MCB9862262.1 glycosyltransferase family 4 protein [Phycisphaerales bacterium]